MRVSAYLVIFSLYLSGAVSASADERKELNQAMSRIGAELVQIYPLLMNAELLGENDKKSIADSTDTMLEQFRSVSPFIAKKSKTYQLSYSLVLEYLEDTQRAIDRDNWEVASPRLSSIGEVCSSCHTQDTKLRTLFSGTKRDKFPSDLAYAEFNYYTRNYPAAEKYYERVINSKASHDEDTALLVFQRLITIYAQIYNLPGEGADKLESYLGLLKKRGINVDQLVSLVFGMKSLQASGLSKVSDVDFNTLKKYVRKYLGPLDGPLSSFIVRPEEEVARVWLRGLLFHYLNKQTKGDELPQILFWLSITDRSLDYNYFYSLADIYLKECIYGYGKHPFAEKCYEEYREYMLFSYTGSAGEFLPVEVEDELETLRERLDAN